jgi:hypothetical protein
MPKMRIVKLLKNWIQSPLGPSQPSKCHRLSRDGASAAHRLPNEIWLEVAELLPDRRDLLTMLMLVRISLYITVSDIDWPSMDNR